MIMQRYHRNGMRIYEHSLSSFVMETVASGGISTEESSEETEIKKNSVPSSMLSSLIVMVVQRVRVENGMNVCVAVVSV